MSRVLRLHDLKRVIDVCMRTDKPRQDALLFIINVKRQRLSEIPNDTQTGFRDVLRVVVGLFSYGTGKRRERPDPLVTLEQQIDQVFAHSAGTLADQQFVLPFNVTRPYSVRGVFALRIDPATLRTGVYQGKGV